jgi:cytochrome c oxidase assembly factor CtaG
VSPLHRLGGVLFAAHMAQHELLMAAAAPLLVLGRPVVAFLWAVPIDWRRTVGAWSAAAPVRTPWEWLTRPLVAWSLHALAIWLWHAPGLYQATLTSEAVHTFQHLSFLGTGLLFWWTVLRGQEGRLGRPFAVIYLFTTAVHTSLLGALLTFSSRLWYPLYRSSTLAWGLTPLEDQQLAGVIMWVPAGLAYLIAALAVTGSWLKDPRRGMVIAQRTTAETLAVLVTLLGASGCRRSSAITRPTLPRSPAELLARHPGHPQYGCASCRTITVFPEPAQIWSWSSPAAAGGRTSPASSPAPRPL